jgi:hypothetical protein
MQFVHQALTGAFLLALLPLLIHVINLTRHQRVQWAAMEFLLASYKKHRRWVWLKQFLLMLSRIAAILLLVMMCAQWITQDQWLSIFAGKATHHFVLIDDSYSMSQRVGGSTAFDQARQVLASLATEASQLDTQHRLTVLRFSNAQGTATAGQEGSTAQYAEQADFNAEPINVELLRQLEDARQKWEPTELAVGARSALETLRELIDPAANENRVVYLLSDFRQKDWENPAELRELLQDLEKNKCDLQLIDCARPDEPNLGVVNVVTETDTKAAGVPMFVAFQVRNYGRTPARRVQVKLRSLFYPPLAAGQVEPGRWEPTIEELPAVLIDEIHPGETVSRRAQVYFPQAGRHVVEVTLPDDCVAADNRRELVIDCPDGQKALVIDGSDEQQHAYYLSAAFHPLERSNTGVRADAKPVSFLRESTAETLRSYTSIYLLDVPRLDKRGLDNLTGYVQAGGGVAIFAGDHADIGYYNDQLFADGQGLLPAPLGPATELPAAPEDDSPDFTVEDHPVFSFFRGERNSFLAGVTVSRYLPTRNDWQRDPQSTVQFLATLRNGKPLMVEKQVGQGRVLASLTTLAPEWNDWAKNPSFVVMVLKLQSYLAASSQEDQDRLVGSPIRLELESTRFLPDITLVQPSSLGNQPVQTKLTAQSAGQGSPLLVATIGSEANGRRNGQTDRAGIYETWTTTLQGEPNVGRFALNVDPSEGNLTTVDPTELSLALSPLKVNFQKAENASYLAARQAGYNRSMFILALLVGLLLAEMALAYSASYHVAARPQVAGVAR